MSDDLEIVTVESPGVVTVPEVRIDVLTETVSAPVVIESPETEVVTIEEDVHVVDTVAEINVVTVGEAGPRGATGAAGPPGAGAQANFAYGDATPTPILTVTADKVVYSVELIITEPFDGTGASVTVGDAAVPDRLMATGENALTLVGSSTTAPAYGYGVDTPVLLSITPGAGASQGRGVIMIRVQS